MEIITLGGPYEIYLQSEGKLGTVLLQKPVSTT